jgi:hypothetical protein
MNGLTRSEVLEACSIGNTSALQILFHFNIEEICRKNPVLWSWRLVPLDKRNYLWL